MLLPQGQSRLGKIEVTALGHTADKVPESPAVQLLQRPGQPLFQRDTVRAALMISPGQLIRPVSGEAAGRFFVILKAHDASPFPSSAC